MSGILDNKSRVLDTVMTTEGRRQLALGGLDIRYVSFTDGATHYSADVETGAADATKRLYLEACQLPQDDISFRAGADGAVLPFRNGNSTSIVNGQIVQRSYAAASGSLPGSLRSTTLTGAEFIDSTQLLLDASIENLRRLYVITTRDRIFEDDGFAVGPETVTFTITNDRPVPGLDRHTTNLSALDSIHSDPRFSHHPNFRYLPPTNKVIDDSLDRSDVSVMRDHYLGRYYPWGRTHSAGLTYESIRSELDYYRQLGYEQVFNFDPTSRDNHLVGQFFERSFNTLKKLDVIDYGVHATGDLNSPTAHVFFVGRVELDDKGTDTFIHLFTLVFE